MTSPSTGEPQIWQCDHCPKVYGSKRALERHQRESKATTTNGLFTCPSCGSSFKRTENLRRHRDQSKCGRQATEGTYRERQLVPAKRIFESSDDEPLRIAKRLTDVDKAISTFIGSPFLSVDSGFGKVSSVTPRANYVLQAIGPNPGTQPCNHVSTTGPYDHRLSRDHFELYDNYSCLLPPSSQPETADDSQRSHGSAMSSPQHGDSNSSESGTRKDSLNFDTPMTSLSQSPPSRDRSKSTTSWLADPDDDDANTPRSEYKAIHSKAVPEIYEERDRAMNPSTSPDPDPGQISTVQDNSRSPVPRKNSLSLRRGIYRRSHLSLEQEMQRLSVDSTMSWPSVGSLFGNSSGDAKRSLRQSIAASMSSVARSTYSMRSEGMPAPMLSQVDEELELARKKSHNPPPSLPISRPYSRHDLRNGLFEAITNNDMEEIRSCLFTELVNPNGLDDAGRTPLILATAHGHTDVVDLLLSRYKKAIDVNLQDPAGCTPLMYACSEGNLILLKRLLKVGKAQVDIQDKHGDTALHILASMSDLDIDMVTTLSTLGKPNLDLRNHDGRTALHLAALQGHKPTVQTLLRDRRYNPIVQEMLGLKAVAGSFVNRQDNTGKTALHLAAANGHTHVVQILLADANVNPNRQCPRGMTALMDAVAHCQLSTVRALVQCGRCEELIRDSRGRNALQIAGEMAETGSDAGGDVHLIVKELWEIQPSEVCVEYY